MRIIEHISFFVAGFFCMLIAAIVFIWVHGVLTYSRDYDNLLFNSQLWRDKENLNERFRMMEDLQYYYLANGMTTAEVKGILGDPDIIKGDSIIGFEIGSSGILAGKQKLIFEVNKEKVKNFKIEK